MYSVKKLRLKKTVWLIHDYIKCRDHLAGICNLDKAVKRRMLLLATGNQKSSGPLPVALMTVSVTSPRGRAYFGHKMFREKFCCCQQLSNNCQLNTQLLYGLKYPGSLKETEGKPKANVRLKSENQRFKLN
jgi:hypothetical protein